MNIEEIEKRVAEIESRLKRFVDVNSIAKAVGHGGTPDYIRDIAFLVKAIKELLPTPKVKYDPNFGDDKLCVCGHTYYRHHDSHEDMRPSNCKYCVCNIFQDATAKLSKEKALEYYELGYDACSDGKSKNSYGGGLELIMGAKEEFIRGWTQRNNELNNWNQDPIDLYDTQQITER